MQAEGAGRRSVSTRLLGWFVIGSALWLAGCCLVLAVAALREESPFSWLLVLYAGVTAVMSAAAFVCYWVDKRRAVRNARRFSERSLHLLALAGGWPGATLGQQLFHHKTQKLKFRLIYWLIVLLHLVLIGWSVWLMVRPAAPVAATAAAPIGAVYSVQSMGDTPGSARGAA